MKINDNVIKEMIEQARRDAPLETCGYLLGTDGTVTESYWMENIDHSSEHFSFAPEDQFAALKYARQHGLKILCQLAQPSGKPQQAIAGRHTPGQ